MSSKNYVDGVLRERWDDATRTYTSWNAAGVQTVSRPYTTQENAAADAEALRNAAPVSRAQYLAELRNGIEAILAARDAAQADIAVASQRQASAVAMSATITTYIQQVSQVANPTAQQLRDAIVAVSQRQKEIADAMAEMFAYRGAVDQNAVLTDNAILWLARVASGTL